MCRRVVKKRLSVFRLAAVLGFAVASLCGTAQAALRVYDPLQTGPGGPAVTGPYIPGTEDAGPNLGGQNPATSPDAAFYSGGWVQAGGDSQVVQHIPSLSYPSYFQGRKGQAAESTQFGCCTFGRTGRPFGDVFNQGQPGLGGGRDPATLYGSFLIDWGTVGTNDPMGGNIGKHGFEMWNGSPATDPDQKLVVDLYVNHYSGDTDLTLNVLTGPQGMKTDHKQVLAGNQDRIDLAAFNGGTHLVVMKLDFNDINGEDRVTVWLDPMDSIEGNWTPAASVGVPAGELLITHHSAFSSFQFDGGGADPGAIDEFRWGDSFADVTHFVPEPTSLTLLALGVPALLFRRRK
jgi:hypothetical protein